MTLAASGRIAIYRAPSTDTVTSQECFAELTRSVGGRGLSLTPAVSGITASGVRSSSALVWGKRSARLGVTNWRQQSPSNAACRLLRGVRRAPLRLEARSGCHSRSFSRSCGGRNPPTGAGSRLRLSLSRSVACESGQTGGSLAALGRCIGRCGGQSRSASPAKCLQSAGPASRTLFA